MKIILIFTFIVIGSNTFAQERKIVGAWLYESIVSRGEILDVHSNDGMTFTDDTVFWRWLSQDYKHRYILLTYGGHKAFIAFDLDGRGYAKGIYKIDGDNLLICDRAFKLGFPLKFSSDDATLIKLRRHTETPRL